MQKTVTGASVSQAMDAVRRKYGDNAIILESTHATDDAPARVHIMLDDDTDGDEGDVQTPPRYGYQEASRRQGRSNSRRRRQGHSVFPPPPDQADSLRMARLEKGMGMIVQRLKGLEEHFTAQIIGTSHRWSAHPLYHHLLQQGLRPGTTTRLFQQLSESGFDPDEESEELQWRLGQGIRDLLDVARSARKIPATLAAIGPSGSGKTSLLLKLATHHNYLGRRETAVLSIEPEGAHHRVYQSPEQLYRRFGLTVETASSPEETSEALGRLADYDHLLIDTPPLPANEKQANTFIRLLEDMLADVMPLHTHLVLSANRTIDSFTQEPLEQTQLEPDAVSFTHLDETNRWGHLLEWITSLGRPVQIVSTSPAVPNGVQAFQASWLVEQMLP